MAIGYIKKKMVEGVETLVPETTAGPSAGTVRKLSFDCNIDYAVPITADETGEGYVGVSGNCKLSFNPKFNIGTVADPEYIGVLKADCFCGKGTNTEIADCVEIGEVCQNLNYKVPFTCNCEVLTACSQNLLFNPNTGLLCSNCMCIANNLEVLCDVCADEYKSRTAGVGITVATTSEDDTLNHNGDVIYKGCDGELATSSCKDFKFNPSTGTLTVDHVCSCDVLNEISNSKLCNTGVCCICYCSSATAEDYGAVEMHAYCCNLTSSELSEGCASLAWDGFHVSCVPFCQSDGSGSTYTCAKIGNGCDIWETQICLTDCTRAYRCGSYNGLCEGVRDTDSNGCFVCGGWTQLGLGNYERTIKKCVSNTNYTCTTVISDCRNFTIASICRDGTNNYLSNLSLTPSSVSMLTSCGSFVLNRDGSLNSNFGLTVSCPSGGSWGQAMTKAAFAYCPTISASDVWYPVLAQNSVNCGVWSLGVYGCRGSDWIITNNCTSNCFLFGSDGSFTSQNMIKSNGWSSLDRYVCIYQHPSICSEICVHADYMCFDGSLEFCSACADELCAGNYVETEDLCVCNTLYTKYICFYS